jgi:hypothetical protein
VAARTYAIIIIGAGTVAALAAIMVFAFSTNASSPDPPAGQFPYWTEGRPTPTPRTEVTGAAIGGDTWESASDMPNGRHGLAAVSTGNKIFVVGGGPQPGLTVSDFKQILNFV